MTRRLVLSYVAVTAFVLLVAELPFGLAFAGRARDRLLADVERDARVLAGLVQERVEHGDSAGVSTITDRYVAQTEGRVVITDADGGAIVDTSRPDDPPRDFSTRPEIIEALGGTQSAGIRRSETLGEELAYVAVPITSDEAVTGVVRVTFPTDTVNEQVRDNWLRLGLLSLLVLAAAASIGWLIAKWAIAPVESLEEGARRLASGDLSGRAEVDRGPPELRRLAATFNDMAGQLGVLIGSQRAFVADASHQLRTPLTALRLRLESLEVAVEEGARPEEVATDLQAIGAELDRMSRLVDGLLALARSEAATAVERVDVADIAGQTVERWSALAEERDVRLELAAPVSAPARAVPGGVDQILDNLLDNALAVAPEGSAVEVTVEAGDGVVLRVRDHGPGMPAEERQRATDRFWRAPGAEPGGTGLGLAIAAELAAAASGSVQLVEPEDGTGLVVEVRLPVGSSSPPVL